MTNDTINQRRVMIFREKGKGGEPFHFIAEQSNKPNLFSFCLSEKVPVIRSDVEYIHVENFRDKNKQQLAKEFNLCKDCLDAAGSYSPFVYDFFSQNRVRIQSEPGKKILAKVDIDKHECPELPIDYTGTDDKVFIFFPYTYIYNRTGLSPRVKTTYHLFDKENKSVCGLTQGKKIDCFTATISNLNEMLKSEDEKICTTCLRVQKSRDRISNMDMIINEKIGLTTSKKTFNVFAYTRRHSSDCSIMRTTYHILSENGVESLCKYMDRKEDMPVARKSAEEIIKIVKSIDPNGRDLFCTKCRKSAGIIEVEDYHKHIKINTPKQPDKPDPPVIEKVEIPVINPIQQEAVSIVTPKKPEIFAYKPMFYIPGQGFKPTTIISEIPLEWLADSKIEIK